MRLVLIRTMPVRLSCVAGVNAAAGGLWRVCSGFESGRVTSVQDVCLVLKRSELVDGGLMRLFKA